MNIYIGADHRGFELKTKLVPYLIENGHSVVDVGALEYSVTDDYPVFARKVAEAVINDKGSRGIVLCGSGIGVSIVSNRMSGARAALCTDADSARSARNDDDANILALGADEITEHHTVEVVETFLSTPFSHEERHIRRLKEIDPLYVPGN